jgi:hypothetical protein
MFIFILMMTKIFISYVLEFKKLFVFMLMLRARYKFVIPNCKNNNKKFNKKFKRSYSNNNKSNFMTYFIKNLDIFILKFLKIIFIKNFLNTLFFLITFLLLWQNVEEESLLFLIYVLVFLVYLLYLRLLKLQLYKYRNTEQNKFFYKNLSIFILNILLLFSITSLISLNNNSETFVILRNFSLDPISLLYVIIVIIIVIMYLLIGTSNLLEKLDEND